MGKSNSLGKLGYLLQLLILKRKFKSFTILLGGYSSSQKRHVNLQSALMLVENRL